jgi:hypothetical protein
MSGDAPATSILCGSGKTVIERALPLPSQTWLRMCLLFRRRHLNDPEDSPILQQDYLTMNGHI